MAHEIIEFPRKRAAVIQKCKGVNIRKRQRRFTFAWDFHVLYQSAVRCLKGVDSMKLLAKQIPHLTGAHPFVVFRITSLMQVCSKKLGDRTT